MNRGDRLVFSNGIVVLAAASSLLIYAFDADLTRLIQLYVIGVFTSFTLSQSWMVVRWLRLNRAVRRRVAGVVDLDQHRRRHRHGDRPRRGDADEVHGGGWISMLFMAILVVMFTAVHRHTTP